MSTEKNPTLDDFKLRPRIYDQCAVDELNRLIAETQQQSVAMERSQHALQLALAEAQQARERPLNDLLRSVFPVEQELAEADGVSDPKTEAVWRELRRRLGERDTLRGLLRDLKTKLYRAYLDDTLTSGLALALNERITAALKESE